jgi:glycosyltransferase involved in cell wall biosynthesis
MPPDQLFVVPDLASRPTGGTLYNQGLISALIAQGAPVQVTALESAFAAVRTSQPELVWVDSLYLDAVPMLSATLAGRGRLGLLLHYLPALVTAGDEVALEQLSRREREALAVSDLVLTTSDFMRETVRRLGFGDRPLYSVEPGCELALSARRPSPEQGVFAVLVAHVVTGKGIEPLLLALASALEPSDRFALRLVGDLDAEPAYAARCRGLVAQEAALSSRVSFCGALSAADVHAELEASNLLLSASVMESYGMALAEGRRVGLPLLACAAGNVRAHVQREAGGELVENVSALAQATARLCRDPAEHERRLEAAHSHLPPLRTWSSAARELISLLARDANT